MSITCHVGRERRRAGTWRTAAPPSSNTAYFHATRNGRNLSTLPTCCAVPVCGDNHHLAPSCPPSEQRAGAGAAVLARCARHCRTGDVHRPPFTLAAGCCSWLSGRVASSELTERRGPAVIKHKRGHWSTTGPGCRSDGPCHPPAPPSDPGAHRGGSWDRPLLIITHGWSVISPRLTYYDRIRSFKKHTRTKDDFRPLWHRAGPHQPPRESLRPLAPGGSISGPRATRGAVTPV